MVKEEERFETLRYEKGMSHYESLGYPRLT